MNKNVLRSNLKTLSSYGDRDDIRDEKGFFRESQNLGQVRTRRGLSYFKATQRTIYGE